MNRPIAFTPARRLTTGASVVFVESSQELPLVSVTLALRTGTTEDPLGKEGLGRLLGRLMRRTAGGRSADDNDVLVDSMGAALGVDGAAASIGLSGTTIARSLDRFVEVLADAVVRPSFAEDEFERLKREIASELVETLDNDRAVARRWFRRKLFVDHPYGRSASGTPASLASITLDDVRAHYARMFSPDNIVFGFAGDVDEARAEALSRRVLDGLPNRETSSSHLADPRPIPGRRLVLVDKPERSQTQIFIGGLGTHPHDDDHTALHVANTIFGGTFTSRLTHEVRAKRGWSYGASSNLPFDRRRQAFSMWTFPKAEDAAACIKLELDLLESWHQKGVTEAELQAAKSYLIRSNAFSIDTATKRLGLALDQEIYDLPPGYFENYPAEVEAVTAAEANAAVKRRISPKDLLVTILGTKAAIYESVQGAIDDLASSEVVAFDAS